jgi:hypothetical protein
MSLSVPPTNSASVPVPVPVPSKNSIVAKNGNNAETQLCSSEPAKKLLESYFKKDIQSLELIGGRKKSDIAITFKDGTVERVQNKDGVGNNRGWSFDRRSLDKYPVTQEGRQLLGNVCLKQGTERPVVKMPENIVNVLILGTEPTTAPTYFTHTQFDTSGTLIEFSICPTPVVMANLHKEAYSDMVPKRTCVHLSPLIYLQRKGGGKADHSPDDIQAKIKSLPYSLFTRLLPETTAK